MKTVRERLAAGEVLLLDGAMGTEIQKLEIRDEDWGGCPGCNEYLVLSAPDRIREVHRAYYAAGSDIVETNTFGASASVLAEFGLAARTREINEAAARLAREAAEAFADGKARYVAGSIGPGTKLASLGQTGFDEIYAAYRPQLLGLAQGGADIFMIETCQDPLHFKAVAQAARDVIHECGRDILILVSVTIETSGAMLVGSDMGVVIALASALDVDILGINCATGPEQMAPYIREISRRFPGFVLMMPNAGMPQNIDGKMVYSLAPSEFAACVVRSIREDGVQLAGGCCGTSPEYIAALAAAVHEDSAQIPTRCAGEHAPRTGEGHIVRGGARRSAPARIPDHIKNATLASLYAEMPLAQKARDAKRATRESDIRVCPASNREGYVAAPAPFLSQADRTGARTLPYPSQGLGTSSRPQLRPFIIGERANTNGSKRFKNLLLAEDWEGMIEVLLEQEGQVLNNALDLSVACTGRDEVRDMARIVALARSRARLPLVFDSTSYEALEAALKLYGGRPIINSVNLEEGEAHAERICRLAKRHGAALIALTIDEHEGMAKTAERKLAVAKRIYQIAVESCGLAPGDLIFDVLTFTLGSGDADSRGSALETLEALRRVKAELPGVHTVLGLSNVSFGLAAQARKVLNSVFLDEALRAGLDMAIMHAASILPPHAISDALRQATLDLIHNAREDALFVFLKFFEAESCAADGALFVRGAAPRDGSADARAETLPVEKRLEEAIIRGRRAGLEALLEEARATHASRGARDAFAIINGILIPAMQTVGELFGSGKMQLPFVLQSAETMRQAVELLQPFITRKEKEGRSSVILATVRGDVHDIGKNLVDIILSNNGYTVRNLGIKCEVSAIIESLAEARADAIGLSGLLVKSTVIMKEYLEALQAAGIRVPVLLGGAALTRQWALEDCQAVYDGPVVYCADAFDGLRALQLLREGKLSDALAADRVRLCPCAERTERVRYAARGMEEDDGSCDAARELPQVIFDPSSPEDTRGESGREIGGKLHQVISEQGIPEQSASAQAGGADGEEEGEGDGDDARGDVGGGAGKLPQVIFQPRAHNQNMPERRTPDQSTTDQSASAHSDPVLTAPFYGSKIVDDISIEELFPLLNEERLFRVRWAMRRGERTPEEFADFLEREALPHRIRLQNLVIEKKLCTPRAVYGYFRCRREEESLLVFDESACAICARFQFPHVTAAPSLLDAFPDNAQGEFGLLPLQVATLGEDVCRFARELYEQGEYREYFLFHGLAVELTETLAAYTHRRIARELGLPTPCALLPMLRRYSFGYPACPDLAQNGALLGLLGAERIGVTESEIGEMIPEFTTSAFLVYRPAAHS